MALTFSNSAFWPQRVSDMSDMMCLHRQLEVKLMHLSTKRCESLCERLVLTKIPQSPMSKKGYMRIQDLFHKRERLPTHKVELGKAHPHVPLLGATSACMCRWTWKKETRNRRKNYAITQNLTPDAKKCEDLHLQM